MGNAIWLFMATPSWLFGAIAHPLAAGPLSAVMAAGVLALLIGVALGAAYRHRRLWRFLISVAGSQCLVVIAGRRLPVAQPLTQSPHFGAGSLPQGAIGTLDVEFFGLPSTSLSE